MYMWRAFGGFWSFELRANHGAQTDNWNCAGGNMRKACRSAERLSYLPPFRARALTRREQEMPRSSGMHDKCFQMAAISLALMVLIALTLSTNLHAQGPALTTISDTV